jgi:hypothetical protein
MYTPSGRDRRRGPVAIDTQQLRVRPRYPRAHLLLTLTQRRIAQALATLEQIERRKDGHSPYLGEPVISYNPAP